VKALEIILRQPGLPASTFMRARQSSGASILTHLALLAIKMGTHPDAKKLLSSFINAHCGRDIIRDTHGNSILHRAVRQGHHDMVTRLLEMGADPFEENAEGMSPAVYGWGFIELYRDDRERYADVWFCMLRILEKQQEIRSSISIIDEGLSHPGEIQRFRGSLDRASTHPLLSGLYMGPVAQLSYSTRKVLLVAPSTKLDPRA
jgi:hypothetical protein